MLYRGPLSTAVLVALQPLDFPVGDAEKPHEGGWQGQPLAAGTNFMPYVVITPGTAPAPVGSFGEPYSEWKHGYQMSSYGVSRQQVEHVGDRCNALLQTMLNERVDGGDHSLYKVIQVQVTQFGAVQRIDATNPAYFTESNFVSIWLSKELT